MDHPQVVCFGEILWDVLPSGEQPGGAPMNVAYHLKKTGVEPALITRIGQDGRGARLMALLESQKLDTSYVQQDLSQTTGVVFAHPTLGQDMRYEIVQPVAWDFIRVPDDYQTLMASATYFVYGSLSARSSISRQSLMQLLGCARTKVCDINVRPPFFNRALAEPLLQGADMLKLNETELPLISGWYHPTRDRMEQIAVLQDRFQIPTIIHTRGAEGALLIMDGQTYSHPGYPVQVADTVGSGDAFLATLLSQFLKGTGPEEALESACAAGALVASYAGACPNYDPKEIRRIVDR